MDARTARRILNAHGASPAFFRRLAGTYGPALGAAAIEANVRERIAPWNHVVKAAAVAYTVHHHRRLSRAPKL